MTFKTFISIFERMGGWIFAFPTLSLYGWDGFCFSVISQGLGKAYTWK